jgi:hypothetical protein
MTRADFKASRPGVRPPTPETETAHGQTRPQPHRHAHEPLPEAGLSDREAYKREELLADGLPSATAALARGDITHVRLEMFQINLDRKSLVQRFRSSNHIKR